MRQIFSLAPADVSPVWILWVTIPLVLVFLLIHVWFARQAERATVTVTEQAISVTGALYGRTIPLGEIRTGEARAVSIADGPYRLTWRANGAAFPGYRSGWFRTRGAGKMLVFITDPSRVVHVPTTRPYGLLLSPADPEGFLGALRNAAESRATARP